MTPHTNPHNPAQQPSAPATRSNTLIYAYEARFARWLQQCFPEIQLATYANNYDMFNSMADVTYYPAFYYNRTRTDWTFNKIFTVYDEELNKNIQFCPFLQTYTGRIYFRNWSEAFDASAKLRFFWNPNCYIKAPWNGTEEVDVSLRLLSLTLDEERAPNENRGAARCVEFKWQSQLFMQNTPEQEAVLVESIEIVLAANKTIVQTKDADKRILLSL